MAQSLKERHAVKRISVLTERIRKTDQQLLIESTRARLIIEAMSQQDLDNVSKLIEKLDSVKAPELPKLSAAIGQAQAEINKYTAGGPISAAWTKMKKLVGIDNPIVKVTTFVNALEQGFSQIPQILKNNGINLKNADLNQSLAKMLSVPKPSGTPQKFLPDDKTDDSKINIPGPTQNEADTSGNAANKLKTVVAQLQKALSPNGIFGAFKKVPYINSAELAQELVQAPLRVFSTVAKRINSGVKAAQIAPDLKDTITDQGAAETKGTQQGAPTKQAAQTQPGAVPKPSTDPTDSTPAGESTPQPQGGGAPDNFAAAKQKVTDLVQNLKKNPGRIDAFVKKLLDAGLDHNKL
jgi:hypothetical protein